MQLGAFEMSSQGLVNILERAHGEHPDVLQAASVKALYNLSYNGSVILLLALHISDCLLPDLATEVMKNSNTAEAIVRYLAGAGDYLPYLEGLSVLAKIYAKGLAPLLFCLRCVCTK